MGCPSYEVSLYSKIIILALPETATGRNFMEIFPKILIS